MKATDKLQTRPTRRQGVEGRAPDINSAPVLKTAVVETVPATQKPVGFQESTDTTAQGARLIESGHRPGAGYASTGPSSWVAARLSPDDVKRRTLRTLTKLLDTPGDTPRLDLGKLDELAREATRGGFGALFAQVFAPHAGKVFHATLPDASRAHIADVTGAVQLLREALPAEAAASIVSHVLPLLTTELTALATLSQEIMALPRGVDGRATARAVDLIEGALLPRIRDARALATALGVDLHAHFAVQPDAAHQAPSAGVNKALASIASQQKADGREISVHVASRTEAASLLGAWLAREPLVDTSAMSPTLVKHLLGRAQTFHWDDTFGKDGIITGHYAGSDHGLLPHLQIHTAGGQEVRVFFPKRDARTQGSA